MDRLERENPLSDDEIDKAVDYLRDTAEITARHKAERVYAEES